ncbi:MAG: sigma 54-interacting transcriptional regulator [Myxococcota bacterium]
MNRSSGPKTAFVSDQIRLDRPKLVVLNGPKKGHELQLHQFRTTIGSDPKVLIRWEGLAPLQVELVQESDGLHAIDRSQGQTKVNGSVIKEAVLGPGTVLDLGGTELQVMESKDAVKILPSNHDRFGQARGKSLVMREIFGVLEAIASTEATVLLLGETGTGKDVLARAIHQASARSEGPIVTVDCGAIAPTLVESELFGHERGAFTGAEERSAGAFERAHGGTLFLDEVGELPVDVQPKLLRALEERVIQRVGGNESQRVDVRIVAATKRDLREEVRRGRFREDLWFRLAVVPLTLPPLRQRRDDIPVLAQSFARAFAERTRHQATIPSEEVAALRAHDWPGNVRELKNTVERGLWLAQTGDGVARFMIHGVVEEGGSELEGEAFDEERSFSEHKSAWEQDFERSYLPWLLARADGSLSKASRLASMDRKHLRNLLRKHELYEAPE